MIKARRKPASKGGRAATQIQGHVVNLTPETGSPACPGHGVGTGSEALAKPLPTEIRIPAKKF